MTFVRLSLFVCFASIATNVLAHTTNINEVTDLFEKSVPNKDQYVRDLEGIRGNGISSIESGSSLQHVQDIDKSESEASRLSSIRAVDLDEEGRAARQSEEYGFYDEGEFEPDLTKPGNKAHQEDVLQIVNATAKLLSDLTGKLKELGINCKTVKGPVQREPVYMIDVKRREQNNTEYDQFFCEEPRNRYSCNDSVTLTCSRKGMKWDPWQDMSLTMLYQDIPSNWWISTSHTDSTYHGSSGHGFSGTYHGIDGNHHSDIEKYIALEVGIDSVDQIQVPDQDILLTAAVGRVKNVDLSNCESTFGLCTDFRNAKVTFHYQYRDGEEICEEWSEDWTERCHLK